MNDGRASTPKLISKNIHLIILGFSLLVSSIALFFIFRFNTEQLSAFGPTALIYIDGIKKGLLSSTSILFISFFTPMLFDNQLRKLLTKTSTWFESLVSKKKNLLIFIICLVFAFSIHGGNVLNGYFNMDDFEVITINNTTSFGQSLLVPHGNDHTMPLFMAEMRGLDILFGTNAVPYNIFMLILFSLIPFFIYLIFKRLKIGLTNFFVFLLLFTGATSWAVMLSGFNIMTTYMQVILFFSIAIWSHLEWTVLKENKYLILLGLSALFAITIDLPGIWVLGAIPLWMFLLHWIKYDSLKINLNIIKEFFKSNKQPLIVFFIVTLAFVVFFIITFKFLQPDTFLTALNGDAVPVENAREENWRLVPLVTNFSSLFASGVSLTTFAPNLAQLVSHPALIDKVKSFWPIMELLIILGNALLIWIYFKYSKLREKKFFFFLTGITLITLSMVVIARPTHEIVPDFDYRFAGPAYYAYILFLSLGAYTLLDKYKTHALKIILPTIIVLLSLQQAFSFGAHRLEEESKLRRDAIVEFGDTLLIELDTLTETNPSLVIPNLSGAHIFKLMSGYTLADYLLFFNTGTQVSLIQNEYMQPDIKTGIVETVSSIRKETSPEFKETLKNSPIINQYYTSPILLRFSTNNQNSPDLRPVSVNSSEEISIIRNKFDPEKLNILGFNLTTDNVPGNLELSLSFKNDFNDKAEVQKIRIDDFTSYGTEENKRIYRIELNLLQIHTYSLSNTISDLKLHIPETKNASVETLYLK